MDITVNGGETSTGNSVTSTFVGAAPASAAEAPESGPCQFSDGMTPLLLADLADASYSNTTADGAPAVSPGNLPITDANNNSFIQLARIDGGSGFSTTLYQEPNGNLVVAFRGTQDLQDLDTDITGFGLQWDAANRQAVFNAVSQYLSGHPDAQLLVTGHSLGGALAQLFTYDALGPDGILHASQLEGLVTFNSPGALDTVLARDGTYDADRLDGVSVYHEVSASDKISRLTGFDIGSGPGGITMPQLLNDSSTPGDYSEKTPIWWLPNGLSDDNAHSIDHIINLLNQDSNPCNDPTAGPDFYYPLSTGLNYLSSKYLTPYLQQSNECHIAINASYDYSCGEYLVSKVAGTIIGTGLGTCTPMAIASAFISGFNAIGGVAGAGGGGGVGGGGGGEGGGGGGGGSGGTGGSSQVAKLVPVINEQPAPVIQSVVNCQPCLAAIGTALADGLPLIFPELTIPAIIYKELTGDLDGARDDTLSWTRDKLSGNKGFETPSLFKKLNGLLGALNLLQDLDNAYHACFDAQHITPDATAALQAADKLLGNTGTAPTSPMTFSALWRPI